MNRYFRGSIRRDIDSPESGLSSGFVSRSASGIRRSVFVSAVCVGLALASAGTAFGAASSAGLGVSSSLASVPPFVYPGEGQAIDFEGDYMFKASPIPGSTKYLIGLFQNGVLQVENLRDYGTEQADFTIRRGDTSRTRLRPDIPTTVMVRGKVNGSWTESRQITVRLVPRQTQVKVLELRYFPLDAVGNIDQGETGICCTPLAKMRERVDGLSSGTEAALENSTRSARVPTQAPYIDYVKMSTQEITQRVPRSSQFPGRPDNYQILNPRNICDWVDNKGVRDVWIWMYHTAAVAPDESNMSMGSRSSAFFNYGSYGDISNSAHVDDLPKCVSTYVVYQFNYASGVENAVHNYGHQRENLYQWADRTMFERWEKPYGPSVSGTRACGNIHFPPNAAVDYAYATVASVPSNCSDWRPDGSGTVAQVGCASWGCTGNPHLQYAVWWAQRMPGRGTSLAFNGVRLRNWHELPADFDKAAALGRELTE